MGGNNYKKPYTIHKTEVLVNQDKLKEVIDRKDMDYMALYDTVVEEYGLDITYKGFMSLLKNRSNWKLTYAWAIADVINVNINDIFESVAIDVEKAKKAKEEWKEKYGNKG